MQNLHGAFFLQKIAMMEHKTILDKIEKLIDQLPYKWVKIEVELPSQTLILEKERKTAIGFAAEK